MQRIYHYDRTTGAYLPRKHADGNPHNFAQPSPAEPGVWLVPAFATMQVPPEPPVGMLAVFDIAADAWKLEAAEVVNPPPPPPTAQERGAAIRAAIGDQLDVVARSQGFKGIDDAVSYAEEPSVVRFQVLGRALRSWRSEVRAAAEDLIAAIDAGSAQMPESVVGLYAVMPRYEPPTAADIEAATEQRLQAT